MTGAPLRVAVIGLGWAARAIWLPRLTADPRYAVVAAVDPAADGRTRAVVPPGCALMENADDLTPATVDLAVVAVPNHLHTAVAAPLLKRGIPVFLEKPVCLSSAEVGRLRSAELGGAVLIAGSAARHRSDVAALARLLPSLGPVRHLELSWIRARGVPQGDGWFTDQRLAGGGALVDLGWHLLDVGFALLGTRDVRQVAGSLSADFLTAGSAQASWRADGERRGAATADVEDAARVLLVTGDGVSILLRTSWASHLAYDLTQIKAEGPAGTARLDCTFGFSPNRVSRSTLTVLRDGVREEVPLTDDPVGHEYHLQVATLRDSLADPATRGRAVTDAARTVGVIEQVYAAAVRPGPRPAAATSRPAAPAGAGPAPVVAPFGEVAALESATAAAARGERFLLHAELPALTRNTAWPRIVSAVRLALLDAVALAYGTGTPIVTLLEPRAAAGTPDLLLRLAALLQGGDAGEIARTQDRLARLPSGDEAAAPAVLRQLKSALAFVRANGGRTAAIEQVLRAATYLAGPPPDSPDGLNRDRLTGRAYAGSAHALVGSGPAEAVNPVVLRLAPGADEACLRRQCDTLDPSRTPGRLLIIAAGDPAAPAAALHEEGHLPAWLCRYQPLADGPAGLLKDAESLAGTGVTVAGVSIPQMNRHMEQVAAIAQLLADRTHPAATSPPTPAVSGRTRQERRA